MRITLWPFLILCCTLGTALGSDAAIVKVAEPFIEMHTGPGRGYPIFHVVERGHSVEVLKRRTDWFKVRTAKGKEGWVHRDAMAETLDPAGKRLQIRDPTLAEFSRRRWEMGIQGGDFDGARLISIYGGYSLTPNLAVELSAAQILGDVSDGFLGTANIVAQPFPHWRLSPFFTLGTGYIVTDPKATFVRAEDRDDTAAHVGIGARFYVSRRFFLRAEYRNHVIFTSRDDNEEIDEWKIGIGAFFY